MIGAMGVLGAVGVEMGILAEVLMVGFIGAETLAEFSVLGSMAAIVFQESRNALCSDSLLTTTQEESNQQNNNDKQESGNSIYNQPFCAWRSW